MKTIAEVEREMIIQSVERFESKEAAARALGIATKTLYNKLRRLGLYENYRGRKCHWIRQQETFLVEREKLMESEK